MSVGIVGGTGPAGRAVAARLAASGSRVIVGSRSAERGAEAVEKIRGRWPDLELDLIGATNEEAAGADLVVVATPWDSAVSTAVELAGELAGKVVVSMANALSNVGGELQAVTPARGSVAVALQCALPQSLIAGAFHHLPAREVAALDRILEADVLVAADHERATAETIALVSSIPGMRGISAGSLSACAAIEAFTAVLVNVNVIHRAHASIRLTGLGEGSE